MSTQAARRYACDRCREQKLRCPRNQPGDSTCARCLRVGAFCVTSSGRPLGRPPLHTNDATRGHVNNKQSSHAQRGREPGRRGRSISSISNPLPSPPSYPASTISGSDCSGASTHGPGSFEDMLNMRLDETDFPNEASGSAACSLDSSRSQPQFCFDPMGVPELDFGDLGEFAEPQGTSLENSTGDADDHDSGQSDNSMSNVPVDGDSMAFLIGVIGSISRQLVELKNQTWGSWDPYQMRVALFDGHDPDFTSSGAVGLNSWENTLSVTMRFVLVLQTMVPAQFSTAPPPYSPPNLSMTLMLLSTYIQLGQLFDTILTRISNCVQESPRHSQHFSPAAPNATRRLLSAQPASLHIAMMIQVFEHQLHSVERLMGLPADCRLWSRKDDYAGILDQEESSALTQAVMGQAQETFRSLKQNIDRIQSSLRASSFLGQTSTN